MEKQSYSVKEVQEILNVSKNTVYDMIKANKIYAVRVGRILRIPKRRFDLWFYTKEGL